VRIFFFDGSENGIMNNSDFTLTNKFFRIEFGSVMKKL
jgi:hypothetical protein